MHKVPKKSADLTLDHRQVTEGSRFFAKKGARFDGYDFIDLALEKGASQVFAERPHSDPRVTVWSSDFDLKMAEYAAHHYDHPSKKMCMIGITGTSGKTTTTHLIFHALLDLGFHAALIGTNGMKIGSRVIETPNTTPDALTLQKFLAESHQAGVTHVVMEVSSHALIQNRVHEIFWDRTGFLNLSPEHLDTHGTLEAYYEAKKLLFTDHQDQSLSQGKPYLGFTNIAHEWGNRLFNDAPKLNPIHHENLFPNAVVTAQGITCRIPLRSVEKDFSFPLLGHFQLENLSLAYAILQSLGIEPSEVLSALEKFPGVLGRMERVPHPSGAIVFVDYAHKPEALEKILKDLSQLKGQHRLITVFGCGGDRDRTKRPVMGRIASHYSDQVILTSDNSRTEDPKEILREIRDGIPSGHPFLEIEDRKQAIFRALDLACAGDLVLIAGKGHEQYQIIGNEVLPFSDQAVVREHGAGG